MKYPQLVSTRAVNAISDWLVSRLEQLGVEAPQIYTRLLLSLLQSTIQLNDPIEFSNLELLMMFVNLDELVQVVKMRNDEVISRSAKSIDFLMLFMKTSFTGHNESFFASRKGGNRRYLDTDALKKFNAVQCLKDIVSSEQEIATIENLVDELCEKLKDIEKQTGDSEDEDKQLVATLLLAQQQNHNQSHHQHHHGHSHLSKSHRNHQTKEVPSHSKSCSASSRGEGGKLIQAAVYAAGASAHNNTTAEQLNDSELDPRDLYFRAFPALSKEMEDSFVTWRRNVKWLTWPVEQRNQDQSISTSSSSSTISSNSAAEGGSKDVATCSITKSSGRDKRMEHSFENASKMPRQELGDDMAEDNDKDASAFGSANTTIGGIRRKSRRRRSRALSKSIQQTARKNIGASMPCATASTTMQNNNGNNVSVAGAAVKNKRSASPTYWDTDFQGCWEMGRDLIKEFITRQNRNCRNRSTSESAVAYNKKSITEKAGEMAVVCTNETEIADEKQLPKIDHVATQKRDIESAKTQLPKAATPILLPVDISFCDYDDYDDTLASVPELTNDGPLLTLSTAAGAAAPGPAKRLYERELISNQSDEQSDYAQFEAKFNSSVEALWKDAGNDEEKGFKPIGNDNKMHIGFGSGSSTHFSGSNSLPFDVSFSQNVKNFLANYYNHHFDLSKMLPTSVIGEKATELNVVMQNKANDIGGGDFKPNDFSKAQADTSTTARTTSEYYSLPNNLNDLSKSKLNRCDMRQNSGCRDNGMAKGGTIGEERKTPVAIFLQNSIWSESADIGGGDTDESFFFKVHNLGKQLNQYDSVGNIRDHTLRSDTDTSSINIVSGGNFAFTTPYTTSKWSEGINAGPPQSNMAVDPTQQLPQKQCVSQKSNFNISLSSNGTDCTDAPSAASLSAISCPNWQVGKGNAKTDLQNAWTTDLTPSTEQARNTNSTLPPATHDAVIVSSPKITLANHSPRNSGFIEYTRVKSVSQLQMSTEENTSNASVAANQRSYPPSTNSKEKQRYALDVIDDGENLLTSERTHFHPIKSYVDGHTFEICSELDDIEYERSSSGYLYLEQDKYLEYTRTDNFMVEDDGGVGASANPLYANSNCEAANANCKSGSCNIQSKLVERDFVIKFRLQRTEIACQTDIEPPTARAPVSADKLYSGMSLTVRAQSHPLSLIFSNAAKNLKANAANELVYSDTVEAFTRAIAHFPPPPPTTNHSTWLPVGTDNRNWNIYQQQSKVLKNTKRNSNSMKCNANDYDDDDAACDEVDFYGSATDVTEIDRRGIMTFGDTDMDMTSLEQQWSMNEIRKKCKEAGHMTTYANTNNNNNASGGTGDAADGGIESVWGMCAACNSEMKSIPANRLLRDELQVEADEIMSDLKYMQDLYIGRAGDTDDADDEDEGCADDDSGADTVTSDSDWCAEDTTAEVVEEFAVKPMVSEEHTVHQPDSNAANVDGDSAVTNDSDTFTVIQKVNRLIAELLRPDNNNDSIRTDNLNANVSSSGEESRAAEKETTTTQFSGNLWHINRNERNIWQVNAADSTTSVGICKSGGGIHPMQLLRQFNVKPIESSVLVGDIFPLPATDDADKYHTQMSWEHENLARIWQTSPPPPQQPQQLCTVEANLPMENVNSLAAPVNEPGSIKSDDKTDIAEKNMRNLRADADASVEAAAANLQQAQEFLADKEQSEPTRSSVQLLDSALKSKAITRKRRHSASQNFFHAQLNSDVTVANTIGTTNSIIGEGATFMQNNNNNEIADLNSYALKSLSSSNANELSFQNLLNASLRFGAAAAAAVAASKAKKCSDYASNLCATDIAYGCDATAAAARNHTIITCKYHLTAIEPLAMHNDGIDDNVGLFGSSIEGDITATPLSCLIDKNQSILKHVTMVSRPLTR